MKTAVITGASSGMGREAALCLAEQGKRLSEVWLIARRTERLFALSETLKRKNPKLSVKILEGDLTEDAFFSAFAERLSLQKPEILFLVNAAGFGKIGAVGELPEKEQAEMLWLNCEALVRMTRLCLPYMAARTGCILNFASAAAFLPQPEFAVYAASKAFVLSFSRALGEELRGREIGVTAVCPGPVATEFFDIAEERHAIPLYKKFVMADAKKVVRKAVYDCLRKRPVSVYGAGMQAFRFFTKLLPVCVFFAGMRLMNGRKQVR